MLCEFEHLVRWEKNIADLGHGTPTSLAAQDALSMAKKADPTTVGAVANNDPQGLSVGMSVSIGPDVESGEQFVTGALRSADADTVSIEHSADEVGTVCVHFPRTGYRIEV